MQKQHLTITIIAFFGMLLFFIFLQLGVTQLQKQIGLATIKNQEKQAEKTREKAYEELLVQQKKRREQKKQQPSPTPKTSLSLVGKETIHLLFAYNPNMSKSNAENFLDRWSTQSDSEESLYFIKKYIEEQAQEYNQTVSLTLNIHPTIHPLELPQVGDFSNPWGKDPFALTKLQDSFDAVISEELSTSNEPILFFYFDTTTAGNIDTVSSFYDKRTFRSFAQDKRKKAYINIFSTIPQFQPLLSEIAIHELLHLYGTIDRYNENSPGCLEESFTTSNSGQAQTDIMCGLLKDGDTFTKADIRDGTIIILEPTAKELGWVE